MRLSNVILTAFLACAAAPAEPVVFAAASTTDVMRELASVYQEKHGIKVRFNFASSGALARQIDAGAPADLFVSANTKWMDWLEKNGRIDSSSRFNLAANTLVLVESNQHEEYRIRNKEPQHGEGNEPLRHSTFLNQNSAVPSGRIAVGDFKSVPVGIYAEEALKTKGWLSQVRPNLVMASSARTALLYVERGEVAAGIVYATDAKASAKVSVIGTFPGDSHSPIAYPAAACSEKDGATAFLAFLISDRAKQILIKHGFAIPENESHR